MQRINSGSNKGRKNSGGGLSKFDKAQMLFQDIENIIEQEMLATPAMQATYEGNVARIKKSKRKGRIGLIRNYNTKKTRQVINNMEFDPDTNTWIGNEDVLGLFSPPQPALIINKSRHDKLKVVGNMTWDPVEKIWKGNEKESRKFTARKPALITPITLGSSAYLQRDVQGMVFDPVTLRWVGNDHELDVFAQIDKLTDDGVTVGNEFHLSSPLARSFIDCANRHKTSLSGWFADGGIDKKAHLYAIRNMSILRIVRDIKQRRTTFVDLDDSSADVPERDTSSSSPVGAVDTGNGNSADATEDYDDFDLTGKTLSTNLKLPEATMSEWDAEFDKDESAAVSQPAATKDEKAKSDDDEDWDDAFGDDDLSSLKTKLKSPSFSPSKVEVPQHGSIVDYSTLRKAQKAAKQQQAASAPAAEEDADGLELPSGPLRLVPANKRVTQPDADALMDGEDNTLPALTAKSPDFESSSSSGEEEDDEDWTDVAFTTSPLSLSLSLSLSQNTSLSNSSQVVEEIDEDGEIELTGEKLVLKQSTRISDDEDGFGDEDMEDGLEIPDNFAARLKR